MRTSWSKHLGVLLLAEVAVALWFVRIQPQCEPCLPGAPCPPCMSDDQRALMVLGGLLPVGVVVAQLVRRQRERNWGRTS